MFRIGVLTCHHHDEHGHAVELVLEVVVLRSQAQPGQDRGQGVGGQRDDAEGRGGLDVG